VALYICKGTLLNLNLSFQVLIKITTQPVYTLLMLFIKKLNGSYEGSLPQPVEL